MNKDIQKNKYQIKNIIKMMKDFHNINFKEKHKINKIL